MLQSCYCVLHLLLRLQRVFWFSGVLILSKVSPSCLFFYPFPYISVPFFLLIFNLLLMMSSDREDWGISQDGRGSWPPPPWSRFKRGPQTTTTCASSSGCQNSSKSRGEKLSITEVDMSEFRSQYSISSNFWLEVLDWKGHVSLA